MDRGLGRGRRADARVQPDPGAPAAVQHPLPRRQVLSLPRADRGGAVAAGAGAPRREAQAGPVLRPLRTRLGDPRHPRCPHPRLPRADVLERVLRPAGARRAALPLLRHRPVRGPVRAARRRVSPRRGTGPTSTPWPSSWRATPARCSNASRARWRRPRSVRSTNRRRRSATSCRRPAGRSRARRWCSRTPEDLDVVGMAEDDLEAAFQVFFVRGGRVLGRKGWVVDRVEELSRDELIASFVRQLYMERQEVPPRVLVPDMPDGADVLEAWLTARRGTNVRIAVPERGAKRKLMEVVTRNAGESFHRHKLRRASDFGARSRALAELAEHLGLEQAPLRIECYDISNLGPTDKVGSMVVFEDGLPKRSDYRRFQIKGVAGQDDFASMEEMLRRRFTRLLQEQQEGPHEGRRFSYPPVARRDRRRPGAARHGHEGPRGARAAHPARRPGEAARGGVLPGPSRPPPDPAGRRVALRAPARARRGPPVRRELPPPEAREARPGLAARRDRRASARRARRRS